MRSLLIYLSLTLVLFVSSRTLLHPEFFRIHDYVHVARLAEMHRALQDGHFPVRWSENFGYGYGMPLFSFYAPLPTYTGVLFVWLGFSYLQSVRIIFFLSSLFTLVASYILCRDLWRSKTAGIIGATLITLAPYRAVNLYIRGALSEAWGIVFIPVILFGIIKVNAGNKFGKMILAVGVAGMLLSHNLVSLMFLPISVVFALIYGAVVLYFDQWSIASFIKKNLNIALGYIWGLALAAFYTFPAFLEKDFTKVESAVTGGYFDYHLHFLYIRQFFDTHWGYEGSGWGPDDSISFSLGIPQLMLLSLTGFALLSFLFQKYSATTPHFFSLVNVKKLLLKKENKNRQQLEFLFILFLLGALLLFSLFMSLTKSQVIWENVSLLAFIQFPWRWLSVALVLIGVIVSGVTAFVPRITKLSLVVFVVLFTSFFAWSQFTPESFLDQADDFYYSDETRIQVQMSDILFDYQPKQMGQPLFPPQELVTETDGASFTFETAVDRVHQKAFTGTVSSSGFADVAIAAFPGWQAYRNGEKIEWLQSERGTMLVPVDEKTEIVSLNYEGTVLQKVSNSISLIALILLIVPVLKSHGFRREYTSE